MNTDKELTIIMFGSAGVHEALKIYDQKEAELRERYPKSYLEKIPGRLFGMMKKNTDFALTMCNAWDGNDGNHLLYACLEEGVFGALWAIGEFYNCGLRCNLEDIPIDQAVTELCDYADINPYEADAAGTYIIATKKAGKILSILEDYGIQGKVIGYTTLEIARIIVGPTERYLTKPSVKN